ncbi:hypothetical protein CIPAW_02G145200 [Carya illinoinensis]|uniref:Uncharacterized protein n=1 Tax=Carya illinoinensis TaxID=32201 RepID=A0A8T1RF00_CARIL|nr:hypothetical protein CIPAW_02G145200 [Carya illinoinensis]
MIHTVGRIIVELQGRINDCRALTYRQDIKARDIEGYRVRMLPTHRWGYVVITTPERVLDHEKMLLKGMWVDPNLDYAGKNCLLSSF